MGECTTGEAWCQVFFSPLFSTVYSAAVKFSLIPLPGYGKFLIKLIVYY
jgi:hypothetical protein